MIKVAQKRSRKLVGINRMDEKAFYVSDGTDGIELYTIPNKNFKLSKSVFAGN